MAKLEDDIKRYLSGELSSAEMHALERKALNDPFLADALEGASTLSPEDFNNDVEDLRKRVVAQRGGRRTTILWSPLKIAAALTLLALSAYIIFLLLAPVNEKSEIAMQKQSRSEPAELPANTDSILSDEPLAEPDIVERTEQPAPEPLAPRRESQPVPEVIEEELADASTKDLEVMMEEPVAKESEESVQPAIPEHENIKPSIADELPAPAARSLDEGVKMKKESRASSAQSSMPPVHQNMKIVTGKVMEANGAAPMPGVSVIVKGTSIGTTTDVNGSFELSVPEDKELLTFTFIGYQTQEVAAEDGEPMRVMLNEDLAQLSEVVVVGYGTERRDGAHNEEIRVARPTGGPKAFQQYLERNVRYPEKALEKKVEGRAIVEFTLSASGQMSNFMILKSAGSGLDEELIRLIKEGPAWMPSEREGVAVSDQVRVKMRFTLPRQK